MRISRKLALGAVMCAMIIGTVACDTESAPEISTTTLPNCVIGKAYSRQIDATGGSGTKTFSITTGALPSGIALSTSGLISGTTYGAAGSYQFTVMVEDSSGSDTQELTLAVTATAVPHPYETIMNNPSSYFVPQASGLCGPTSFYMAFKYHGDHLKTTSTGYSDPADLMETVNYPDEITEDTKIAKYIQTKDDESNSLSGISLTGLKNSAQDLMDGSGNTFYNDVRYGINDLTGTDDSTSEEKEAIFLNEIVPMLDTNTPVVIHLWRSIGSGHYVLVVGYDATEGMVYFMDPYITNHEGNECACAVTPTTTDGDWTCFLQKVDFTDFIYEYWYKSDQTGVYNARWDGNWIGFRQE